VKLLGRALGAVLVAVPIAALAVGAGAPAAAEEPAPTLTVTPAQAAPGTEVRVDGEGWPVTQLVMVEVCGQEARNGSADCAQDTARSLATNRSGRVSGRITIPTPPTPCPCVVHAFVPTAVAASTAPLDVVGVATAPLAEVSPPPPPPLELEATVDGESGVGAVFGGAPRRVLHVVVRNVSDETVTAPRVVASWGRGAGGDGYIDVPAIDAIEPGGAVRLDVPFDLPPVAVGGYAVSGEILGVEGTRFRVSTSSYPWGLAAVPGLACLHVVGLRVRDRIRRRTAAALGDGEPTGDVDLREPDVIDLRAPDVDLREPGRGDRPAVPSRVDEVDEEPADDRELVGAGAGGGHRRTYGGLALALVCGISLMAVRDGPASTRPLSREAMCEELEGVDAVAALAASDTRSEAVAIEHLAGLADRVPVELQPSARVLQAKMAQRPGLEGIGDAAPEDADAWNAAFRAVYGLELDGDFTAAAARFERYAVEECDMAPSGVYDLDVEYGVTPPPAPEVALPEATPPDLAGAVAADLAADPPAMVEAPMVDLDPATLGTQGSERIVEPPQVHFDLSELHQRYGR
jgi:hypothetical protein